MGLAGGHMGELLGVMRWMGPWANLLQRKLGDQADHLAGRLPPQLLIQPDTLQLDYKRTAGGKRIEDWSTVACGQITKEAGHLLVVLNP